MSVMGDQHAFLRNMNVNLEGQGVVGIPMTNSFGLLFQTLLDNVAS